MRISQNMPNIPSLWYRSNSTVSCTTCCGSTSGTRQAKANSGLLYSPGRSRTFRRFLTLSIGCLAAFESSSRSFRMINRCGFSVSLAVELWSSAVPKISAVAIARRLQALSTRQSALTQMTYSELLQIEAFFKSDLVRCGESVDQRSSLYKTPTCLGYCNPFACSRRGPGSGSVQRA